MIIVTGGAGFIGSNIVHALNQQKLQPLVVDDLTDGRKFKNLADAAICDYLDKDEFLKKIIAGETFPEKIEAIFHQGACSVTTEWDGRLMMQNNYAYSKILLHYCLTKQIAFIYASSAAIYGDGKAGFTEQPSCEKPLNMYGYSKYQFDQYVRQFLSTAHSQIVGLRYFNVYGPREQHKGNMASVAWHLHQQLLEGDEVRLFVGSDGYAPGAQQRDFIYVDDAVNVNLWFWRNPQKSGIFNVGTGKSQTFNAVAQAIIHWHQHGKIRYIDFPEKLKGRYQSFTEADISALRQAGYSEQFKTVAEGVRLYLDCLKTQHSSG